MAPEDETTEVEDALFLSNNFPKTDFFSAFSTADLIDGLAVSVEPFPETEEVVESGAEGEAVLELTTEGRREAVPLTGVEGDEPGGEEGREWSGVGKAELAAVELTPLAGDPLKFAESNPSLSPTTGRVGSSVGAWGRLAGFMAEWAARKEDE